MPSQLEQLKSLLAELNIRPLKRLGQNFLINLELIDRIVAATLKHKPKLLIEVGPGAGALTQIFMAHQVPMKVIELDRTWAQYWRAQAELRATELEVIEADALQWNWQIIRPNQGKVLVSNLPYQIAASLVVEQSALNLGFSAMVLMFQREVAERMRAETSEASFGLLSVVAQTFWQINKICDAGPSSFFPAPQVSSRVLEFLPQKTQIVDRSAYLQFLKSGFAQPRKQVARFLIQYAQRNWGVEESRCLSDIERLKIGDRDRAQNIPVRAWQQLFLSWSLSSNPESVAD